MFSTQKSAEIDICLATSQKTKEDWVKVASESTGESERAVQTALQDVFQDASD